MPVINFGLEVGQVLPKKTVELPLLGVDVNFEFAGLSFLLVAIHFALAVDHVGVDSLLGFPDPPDLPLAKCVCFWERALEAFDKVVIEADFAVVMIDKAEMQGPVVDDPVHRDAAFLNHSVRDLGDVLFVQAFCSVLGHLIQFAEALRRQRTELARVQFPEESVDEVVFVAVLPEEVHQVAVARVPRIQSVLQADAGVRVVHDGFDLADKADAAAFPLPISLQHTL